MEAFKEFIWRLFEPLATFFVMLKYKNIWGLKVYLKESGSKSKLLNFVYNTYFLRRGSWVGIGSEMATTPCFPHGVMGITISERAKFGKDVVIFQYSSIIFNSLEDSPTFGSPTIGNNVYIGAGATIVGNITIGDNCRIGAGAVVCKDMAPNTVAVLPPTRYIPKQNLDNTYYAHERGRTFYYKDGRYHLDNRNKANQEKNR